MSKRRINRNVVPSHPDCERCKRQRERYRFVGIPRMKLARQRRITSKEVLKLRKDLKRLGRDLDNLVTLK